MEIMEIIIQNLIKKHLTFKKNCDTLPHGKAVLYHDQKNRQAE